MKNGSWSPARYRVLGFLIGIGLAAAAGLIFRNPASSGVRSKPRPARAAAGSDQAGEDNNLDIVDIASEESFPASDAPAY